jgi:hypothetical protein
VGGAVAASAIGSTNLLFPKKAEAEGELTFTHDLYEILYNNSEDINLRTAIYHCDKRAFELALYIIHPLYPWKERGNPPVKMGNPGKDNPAYWVTLKLAYDGINDSSSYHSILNNSEENRIPLPQNKELEGFIKMIDSFHNPGQIIVTTEEMSEFGRFLTRTPYFFYL